MHAVAGSDGPRRGAPCWAESVTAVPYHHGVDVERLLAGLDPTSGRRSPPTAHPLCILAGAGSGKTRVLTHRIAHRALTGDADPRRVLALTFTRKAAAELDSRLRTFGLRDLPAAGTFHATAYAQLRGRWAGLGGQAPTLLDRKGRILGRVLGSSRQATPGRPRRRDRVGQGSADPTRGLSPRRPTGRPHATARGRPHRHAVRPLRAGEAQARTGRLRRPARAVRPCDRDRSGVRGRAALAVPAPVRRRVPGREPAAGAAPAGLARRRRRPVRRRRSEPGHLPAGTAPTRRS